MSELITQINTLNEGNTTVGEYPDPAIQVSIEAAHRKRKAAETNARTAIDLNNLNHQYTNAVALAEGYFVDQGLDADPVRVVDRQTMQRAYDLAGVTPDAMTNEAEGRNVFGRAVVIENQEAITMFGDDFVLGVALHEGAHSIRAGEGVLRIVAQNGNGISTRHVETHNGNLGKADLRKDAQRSHVANFWEEAFVDLTRVRALRVLGRTHDIAGNTSRIETQGGTVVVGVPNGTIADQAGIISFPAEFALLAKTIGGKNWIARSASNFAAYALELLNNATPGLYEDFLAARQDPTKQRDAIQKVEAVHSGLYRQLRDIPYTEKDFVHGLVLVMDALGHAQPKQTTAIK